MEKEIKEEELFIPKTKHKALKIILAIILIGALAFGGYYLYKEKYCNPNKTVTSIIEDAEKKINNSINDNNVYKLNGILKINANLSDKYKSITDIINKLDLQFIVESDLKNKLVNATLNAKYKTDQLVDVQLYTEENSGYVLLQGIYDKYLKLSLDDMNKKDSIQLSKIDINEEDIKTIINSLMKASKNTLNNLEFKRINAAIKIDDTDYNVYNNYVDLKNDEVKKLLKDIGNTLSNDNEFIKVLKKTFSNDVDVNNLINAIDKKSFPGTYRLSFYTDKGLTEQKLVSARLEITNDNVTTSVIFDKINDSEMLFQVNTNGIVITNRIKKTNSVFNVNLNANIMGMTIKLDLSSNYEKIKEVTKPDVSDSKKIEELTEEENNAIGEKIQSNKGMINLIQDISKLKNITM